MTVLGKVLDYAFSFNPFSGKVSARKTNSNSPLEYNPATIEGSTSTMTEPIRDSFTATQPVQPEQSGQADSPSTYEVIKGKLGHAYNTAKDVALNTMLDGADAVVNAGTWLGETVSSAYDSFVGLFNTSSDAEEKVITALGQGNTPLAVATAREHLESKLGVKSLVGVSDDKILTAFTESMKELDRVAGLVQTGKMEPEEALRLTKLAAEKITALPINDEKRVAGARKTQNTIVIIVTASPAEKLVTPSAVKALAEAQAAVSKLVSSIKDENLRATVAAEVSKSNDDIASYLKTTLGKPENQEYANTFIASYRKLELSGIKNDMLKDVMNYLLKNRIEQADADAKTGETVRANTAKIKRANKNRDIRKLQLHLAQLRLKNDPDDLDAFARVKSQLAAITLDPSSSSNMFQDSGIGS